MIDNKQLVDTLMIAINEALANMHTATIAKITKVNQKTINCRPVINRWVRGASIPLPEFAEVPPLFLQGGGSYTAHPIAVDDYCLLIFTERCFDRWYNGQDFQPPLEFRMHDYSDGIAIVGLNPLAGAIAIPSVIQQTGDTNQDGNYTHQGNMTRTGVTEHNGQYTINGDLIVNGDIICDQEIYTEGSLSLSDHTHPGDSGGTTGVPNS